MPALPTGTVTFLFTDIEGSTCLLQQLGDRYAEILATHHRLLRSAIQGAHGQVVDTQGDAVFAVFPRARDIYPTCHIPPAYSHFEGHLKTDSGARDQVELTAQLGLKNY